MQAKPIAAMPFKDQLRITCKLYGALALFGLTLWLWPAGVICLLLAIIVCFK